MITEVTIVIPTFNERENVSPIINALERSLGSISWEAIFVDDNSPDGTAEHVQNIAKNNPRISCIKRLGRRGLSSACLEGILASSSPYVAVMDADLQHDEVILPDMLNALTQENYTLVVGSRYLEGGGMGSLVPGRITISRFATWLGRLFLKTEISDPMSGFFMIQKEYFNKICEKLSVKGFKILLDILISSDTEIRIKEIPYVMRSRLWGDSKLDTPVIWEYCMLIADKFFGRIIPPRFALFVTVGTIGVGVHLSTLFFLYKILLIDFISAQALSTIIAMTNNFILNNIFTYRDMRLRRFQFIRGLMSFYISCSIGALINTLFANYLFNLNVPWIISGFIGAVIGSIWNYAINSTITWKE
ncbi:MAG: dolichol monophosphate mannose synthase [Thermodesulfobacteriota bacterium]|nr:MAG: dolichol monophosphate mannose synthase [Thermodesulfobacteriota bacterium]